MSLIFVSTIATKGPLSLEVTSPQYLHPVTSSNSWQGPVLPCDIISYHHEVLSHNTFSLPTFPPKAPFLQGGVWSQVIDPHGLSNQVPCPDQLAKGVGHQSILVLRLLVLSAGDSRTHHPPATHGPTCLSISQLLPTMAMAEEELETTSSTLASKA